MMVWHSGYALVSIN